MTSTILILNRYGDEHVSLVTKGLSSAGAPYFWFDPADFPSKAEVTLQYDRSGPIQRTLRWRGRDVELSSIRVIWDRQPAEPLPSSEVTDPSLQAWVKHESRVFLAGLWDSLDCWWVPGKPGDVRSAYEKMYQLTVASQIGFRIPRTRIGNRPQDLTETYAEYDGHLVSKSIAQHLVKRNGENFLAFTHVIRRRDAVNYRSIRYAPLILQEYVPKELELRITVVGSRVFAAEIHSQATRSTRDDWRHYDLNRTPYLPHRLPARVEGLCTEFVRALGLCFGAIDMILTPEGEYVFLEINPNGQWGWIQSLTGLPIGQAIAELLASRASAAARVEFGGSTS